MNQKGFANIILVVVIVMLVSAVGYFAFVKKSGPITQQPTPTSTPTQTTTPTKTPVSPTPTPTPKNETASWITYTNKQIGLTFRYPSRLGKIDFELARGDVAGERFAGKIADGRFGFYGLSSDFKTENSGSPYYVNNYLKENNKYFLIYHNALKVGPLPTMCEDFVKEVRGTNTSGILIKGLNPTPQEENFLCITGDFRAIMKLKSSHFPTVVFWVYPPTELYRTKVTLSELEAILATVEIE